MNVTEAVVRRRSVRAFTTDAVEQPLLVSLVERAARAPSGGNLQPWHIDLVLGNAMVRLKALMRERLDNRVVEAREYPIYPEKLSEPYFARRSENGECMYANLGIARNDRGGRRQWFARNFDFFGAPAGIFVTVQRDMGSAQWSDLGMYLQTFMLLAVEQGLATCSQESWALYPETITNFIRTPKKRMLFCGVAIGFEDLEHPVNRHRSVRAPLGEWFKPHM